MSKNDKTIFDPEETVLDSDETIFDPKKTVLDSDETVPDPETAATLPDNGAAIPDNATVLDDETAPHDGRGTLVIEKGASLLETYRIESDAIEGGMGAVWRVHHTGWNVDLAMKRPKAGMFQTEEQKETFIRECNAWINLGLHPHIVSCYYVRRIRDIPTIFSEWMDGGSLKNTIEDGRLYEGNAAGRILDLAIQFARGLHYAHEQGLIHQDVKPDNLLLTKNWDAKVADFGIARARATLTVPDAQIPTAATMFSAAGGYTPAYCSMEQQNGEPLTRRTDIYSWAVSVLEMYLGDRPWQSGVVAGAACEEYFPDARVPIPPKMRELLKECLSAKETERPHDFTEVENRLLEIYREETKEEYPRPVSKAAADTADSLNNRALSMLDLGKVEEAEKCWQRALTINPVHKQAVYNQNLHRWRTAQIDDREVLAHVGAVDDERSELIAQIHAERGQARCIRTFSGHDDRVYSVSISSDGQTLLSGSYGKMKLWDLSSGVCLRTIAGHHQAIKAVSLRDGGTMAISGAEDQAVKLWDAHTGVCLHTCLGHTGPVEAVAFSPNGKLAVSGSSDGTLKLWEVETGALLHTFTGHQDKITAACFLPCGTKVLSGSWDHTLKLWNIESGACIRTFTGHEQYVETICLTPDGSKAASGSRDNTIRLWELHTGACIGIIPRCIAAGDKIPVQSIRISPDGSKLAMGSGDGTVKLWDLHTKRCLRTYTDYPAPVLSVAFTPDGKHIVSSSTDKTIRLWELPSAGHAAMALNQIQTMDSVAFFRNAFDRIQGEIDTAIRSGEILTALDRLEALRHTPIFNESSEYFEQKRKIRRFCSLGSSLSHHVISVRENRQPAGSLSRCSCFSRDGNKELYTNHWDEKDFYLRYLDGTQAPVTFTGHTFSIKSLCFNADATKALSASWDHTMKLWDTQTGRCLRTFIGHEQGVNTACFSPDDTKLLSGGMDKKVKLWDIASGACLDTFHEHTEYILHVAFEPDSMQATATSATKTMVYLIDYRLSFPGWSNWDESARPYLRLFLTLHPNWTAVDFDRLITELQNLSYGWLRPEGVRAKLQEMEKCPSCSI